MYPERGSTGIDVSKAKVETIDLPPTRDRGVGAVKGTSACPSSWP